MPLPPHIRLTEAEKDALLLEQAALIERMAARIAELEALVGKPRKTSSNSSLPPSQDGPGRKNRERKRSRKPRPSRPGAARPLADTPDQTECCLVEACPHCGAAVAETAQQCRERYDHVDLSVVRPEVTRVEVFGGRCHGCGRRYRAPTPAAMPPAPCVTEVAAWIG
ncbi:transposase [Rhodovastum atsumiense]|nr:transposase [Rhodovastum atsumiense]